MQEHGAKIRRGGESKANVSSSLTFNKNIYIHTFTSVFFPGEGLQVSLTRHCVVDAWPVLTAVSFQPHSDGSEGEHHIIKFMRLLIHAADVTFDSVLFLFPSTVQAGRYTFLSNIKLETFQ